MKTIVNCYLVLLLVSGSSMVVSAGQGQSKLSSTIRLPHSQLLTARERVRVADAPFVAAVAQLDTAAQKLLNIEPFTIVRKTVLPASGNVHDYFSFAPYWWPNPDTKDGMPWIQLDGKINPTSRDAFSDKVAFNGMVNTTQVLSSAYFFTGDQRYAKKTAELIRVWFLDEATKMNPHLRYAQAIPGKFTGRGIGIIDTRLLYRVIDSILLVNSANVFSKSETEQLKQWFTEYLDWLVHSQLGIDEREMPNNHGTFYDFQVVAIAMYVGQHEIARTAIEQTKQRMVLHFDSEGKQKRELERTRPFHYSVFNLQAYFGVAHIAESIGVDLWNYPSADDARLKRGMDYLLTRMMKERNWGGKEELAIEADIIVPLLPEYARAYKQPIASYVTTIVSENSQWPQCALLFSQSFDLGLMTDGLFPCFY